VAKVAQTVIGFGAGSSSSTEAVSGQRGLCAASVRPDDVERKRVTEDPSCAYSSMGTVGPGSRPARSCHAVLTLTLTGRGVYYVSVPWQAGASASASAPAVNSLAVKKKAKPAPAAPPSTAVPAPPEGPADATATGAKKRAAGEAQLTSDHAPAVKEPKTAA
jgi:hypothetical protein